MRRYWGALIDVDRFFGLSGTPAERARVYDLFSDAGFPRADPFLDLGGDGHYVLFGGHAIEPPVTPGQGFDLSALSEALVAFMSDWISQRSRTPQRGRQLLSRQARTGRPVRSARSGRRRPGRAAFSGDRGTVSSWGAGYGELCILLALRGFRATAIESSHRRCDGAAAMMTALSDLGVGVKAASILIKGRFPRCSRPADLGQRERQPPDRDERHQQLFKRCDAACSGRAAPLRRRDRRPQKIRRDRRNPNESEELRAWFPHRGFRRNGCGLSG